MSKTLSQIDPAFLKTTYLFGIPLTDPDGKVMQDSVFEFYRDRAVAELEAILDVSIRPQEGIEERHDFNIDVWRKWSFLQLHRRPIRRVQSWDVRFGASQVFEIPADWIRVSPPHDKYGHVQLFPSLGTFSSTPALDRAYVLAPILMSSQYAPDVFRVVYDVGMTDLTEDMVDAIGMMTIIQILNVLGDILLGAGIASLSIGLDGFSQSIGTTQSAENSAYSARIRMYQNHLYGSTMGGEPGLLSSLKKRWQRPLVTVL